MPRFRVLTHRRIHKFLRDLENERVKDTIKSAIIELDDYPLALRELDIEKIKGLEKTFRIRVGKYRIIFYVDKTERTIYVTHVKTRRKAYKG